MFGRSAAVANNYTENLREFATTFVNMRGQQELQSLPKLLKKTKNASNNWEYSNGISIYMFKCGLRYVSARVRSDISIYRRRWQPLSVH